MYDDPRDEMKINSWKEGKRRMRALDVMMQHAVKVKEDDSFLDVIDKMVHHRVNTLPVVNEGNEILGSISVEDILHWLGRHHVFYNIFYASGVWLDQEPLESKINRLLQHSPIEIANRKTVIVPMEEEAGEVASLLYKKHAGCVLVEGNGVLKGMISSHELIRGLFRKQLYPVE